MATGSSRSKGIRKWKQAGGGKSPAQKRASKLDRALTPRGKKVVTSRNDATAPF
jgi:hypothetical protein